MAPPISIRLFRPSDMDRILQIERQSFGKYAWDRNLVADFFHKCGDLFLVATQGRDICGYSLTCVSGRTDPPRAELASIAVDPRYRNQGIASILLDSTIRRLRRRRVSRIALVVKVTNTAAIRFYEWRGFDRGRLLRAYYEDGVDGRRYQKLLE